MNYFRWFDVLLQNGERFMGSPYPTGKNYNFWYIDYVTIKSRIIPMEQVVSMKEVA